MRRRRPEAGEFHNQRVAGRNRLPVACARARGPVALQQHEGQRQVALACKERGKPDARRIGVLRVVEHDQDGGGAGGLPELLEDASETGKPPSGNARVDRRLRQLQASQDVSPRPQIGGFAVGPAAAVSDLPAAGPGGPEELVGQTGFADARRSAHDRELWRAGCGRVEQVDQRAELGVASDERQGRGVGSRMHGRTPEQPAGTRLYRLVPAVVPPRGTDALTPFG